MKIRLVAQPKPTECPKIAQKHDNLCHSKTPKHMSEYKDSNAIIMIVNQIKNAFIKETKCYKLKRCF